MAWNSGWGVTYTNAELEFDSAIGVTFSAPNPATDYKNGEAFIWDWAVGKKFSNGLQMGVAGFAYQQLTADSGSGARLGPFKGRVFGIGPPSRLQYGVDARDPSEFQFS